MASLVDNLVRFEQALHAAGIPSSGGRMPEAVTALEAVGVASRPDVRAALRSVLVNRREDLAIFDRVFDLFWRARQDPGAGLPLAALGERPRVVSRPTADAHLDLDDDEVRGGPHQLVAGAYSVTGFDRRKDFAEFTPEELARAAALFDRLDWRLGVRRSRRWTASRSGAIDLRGALGRSRRAFGELLQLPRRRRLIKPRPIIVLADVSGSMERYSRVLLQFVYAVARGAHRVESFVFATRLTRVTQAAADRRRGGSIDRIVRSVQDWGGGTRIGEALRAFNVHWSRRVVRNGPVVLLISDGWDRGDPAALMRELARIRRSCRRLIWLNPLLGSADYEPLTRGMMAALPLVDDFMPVHNLESLERLSAHLQRLSQS